jgi:hypothetical protein
MPRIRESAKRPVQSGPILATRPHLAQARGEPAAPSKRPPPLKSAPGRRRPPFSPVSRRPIRFPISSPSACRALIGRIMTLEFDHFADLAEFDEVDLLQLPFADIVAKPSVPDFRPAVRCPGHSSRFTMKDEKDKDEGQSQKPAKNPKKNPSKDPSKHPSKDPRQDRLKLALRENLKRRKSQARGRSDVAVAPSNGDGAAPHDVSGKKSSE